MALELVGVDEMRTGRGSGKKGGKVERYTKYKVAIAKTLPWLKEQIEEKGTIRARTTDIAREMGQGFAGKDPTSIYWALKYTLFHEGIFVLNGKTTEDEPVLVMRTRTPDDELPSSLEKFDKDKVGKGKVDEGEVEEEPDEDLKEEDE